MTLTNNYFDITGVDIAKLDDTNLRLLVGLLCEEELYKINQTRSGVFYGGHQDATDGGIDVEVNTGANFNKSSFIPRTYTGFQVKKPDMSPSAIKNEMKPSPENSIRESIIDLANKKGAYIIVSSSTNATKTKLKNRLDAMKEIAQELPNGSDLHLAYYDQNQLATWVREYPALQLWVNNKIDTPIISGWFPYGNWSHSPYTQNSDEYIFSDDVRVYPVKSSLADKGSSISEGIQNIRRRLANKGASIRIVGLSGVGKTRFVEALFDDRINGATLNKANVIYTDMGFMPRPMPLQFIHQIRNNSSPLYLVVDNCSRETHRELCKACADSEIRLLTVEYDVKDDLPPETDCFRMEPASSQVIEKVIAKRYPNISHTDIHTIASFSEGNARIAIALANTIGSNDNLGNLSDEELFHRLFWQRNLPNNELLRVARVCALVYSFDSIYDESPNNEITILAGLLGVAPQTFRANLAELERRTLVQSRSNWKALLPHALANKLAIEALQEYPAQMLLTAFRTPGNNRLFISFAHRISYLHNIPSVQDIVRKWFEPGEYLDKLFPYSELNERLMKYSAPIIPEATLSLIEKELPSIEIESFSFNYVFELLRLIGYEQQYFERVVNILIAQYATNVKSEANTRTIEDILKTYFQIWLSGTYASIEQRIAVLHQLFDSENSTLVNLAEKLLEKTLFLSHISGRDCQFGSHHRDYGYIFKGDEIDQWITKFSDFACDLIEQAAPYSNSIKRRLAIALPTIIESGRFEIVERIVVRILNGQPWTDAGISIKNFTRRNRKRITDGLRKKIDILLCKLIPQTLEQQIEVYALSGRWDALDIDDEDFDPSLKRQKSEEKTCELGMQLGTDMSTFIKLLPRLIEPEYSRRNNRLYFLGVGLAKSKAIYNIWDATFRQFCTADKKKRDDGLLKGLIDEFATVDLGLKEFALKQMIEEPDCYPEIVDIQIRFDAKNPKLHERLMYALDLVPTTVNQWSLPCIPSWCDCYEDETLFIELVTKIRLRIQLSDEILIDVLHSWIEKYKNKKDTSLVRDYSLTFIGELKLEGGLGRHSGTGCDYDLSELLKLCCLGKKSTDKEHIRRFLNHYRKAILSDNRMDWFGDTLSIIGRTYPEVLLDIMLPDGEPLDYHMKYVFGESAYGLYIVNQMPISSVKNWASNNLEERIPKLAEIIQVFTNKDNVTVLTPLAIEMVELFPNTLPLSPALFDNRIAPSSWDTGSLESIIASRISSIKNLRHDSSVKVKLWANEILPRAQEVLSFARELDRKSELRHDRFE